MSNYMIFVIFIVLGVFLCMEGIYRFISRKLDRLMNDVRREGAQIITKGMMREGNIQAPCVLQVYDKTLFLTSLVKSKRFSIPLKDIKLIKEGRWLSRGLRWGRYAFHLDTPKTNRLIIAVRDPKPWRNTFLPPLKDEKGDLHI